MPSDASSLHGREPTAPARGTATSVPVLVVANLVPLVGVLFFDWDPFRLLLLYWLESAVIGIYNVPRMLLAPLRRRGGEPAAVPAKIPIVLFFAVHYSGFMLGHLLFLMVLCGGESVRAGIGNGFALVGEALADTAVWMSLVAFALSHGYSFAVNYVGRREFERTEAGAQMTRVYPRVIVMHVAVLAGAFLMTALTLPSAVLVVLIGAKTWLDVRAHRREHARSTNAEPLPAAVGGAGPAGTERVGASEVP